MEISSIQQYLEKLSSELSAWMTNPAFYSQTGIVLAAVIIAYLLARLINLKPASSVEARKQGIRQLLRNGLQGLRELAFPLFTILLLMGAVDLSDYLFKQSWLVRVAEGLAMVMLLYTLIGRYVRHALLEKLFKLVLVPITLLQVFGLLGDVITYLQAKELVVGNISISAYGLFRVLIFGTLLFWLGRISNSVGQRVIRQQESLDIGTREIFAKIYQVVLVVVIFLLLLQVMGVNITALAVFGGAVGVGLGFGLQAIASNFISGLILLLDRSLAIGDYIELEDGRKGTISEMSMRFIMLETFDGKEIMVPNEKFITTSFTNWTHSNKKQRYSLNFQVAYSTDLHHLFDLLREVVASHPMVLSGDDIPIEFRPDAEISGFGDSGVDILIEFWMEGIDDGPNRVGADLLLMIWDALKANQIEIPFPQREVKIIKMGETHQPGAAESNP